jgi:hypothetical protein
MSETTTKTQTAPVSGYGDEGAKILAAAYLADRFEQLESWLHGLGLKSSFMQNWMKSGHRNVGDRLEAPHAPSDFWRD